MEQDNHTDTQLQIKGPGVGVDLKAIKIREGSTPIANYRWALEIAGQVAPVYKIAQQSFPADWQFKVGVSRSLLSWGPALSLSPVLDFQVRRDSFARMDISASAGKRFP